MEKIERVAVTGGSGHLGTAVILEALARGLTVYAGYSSYKPKIENSRLTWFQGDLGTTPLEKLLGDAQAVIHTAARISVHGDKDGSVMKTNVEGTRNLLDLCRARNNIRLVHVSSAGCVVEKPSNTVFDESRPLKGAGAPAYDYSKALAEELVRQYVRDHDVDAVIVRPSGIFGQPDLRGSIISTMMKEIYMGKLPVLISGGYDLVDVRDVAIGTLNAMTMGRKGETYLLSGLYQTLKDLAHKLEKLGGAKAPPCIPVSLVIALLPLVRLFSRLSGSGDSFTREGLTIFRDGHPNMDSGKARKELDYQPRPIEDSLHDLVSWWREEEQKQ